VLSQAGGWSGAAGGDQGGAGSGGEGKELVDRDRKRMK
jgi:hypothetical protein